MLSSEKYIGRVRKLKRVYLTAVGIEYKIYFYESLVFINAECSVNFQMKNLKMRRRLSLHFFNRKGQDQKCFHAHSAQLLSIEFQGQFQ